MGGWRGWRRLPGGGAAGGSQGVPSGWHRRSADVGGGGELEAPLAARRAQVDPPEDGRHLGGRDLEALGRWRREAEAAAFQPLVPQRITITVPVEDLEAVAAAVAEDEEVAREGVLPDDRGREGRQRVESLAEVGRLDGQEDADGGGEI